MSRATLEGRLAAVEEEIATDRELVEQLEWAIATDAPPPTDVAELYREAGAPLPGLAERKRVCESLLARLRVQSEQVQVRIALREEERESLERRLAQGPSLAAPGADSGVSAHP